MSKFSRFSLAISYLLFVSTIVGATNVRYCNKKDYSVKVQGVDISPDPVVSGESATFSISASTETVISSGKLVIEVIFFGLHIHSETHDLCAKTKCPVSTGDFVVQHSQILPGFTPHGTYSLQMKMLDEEENELTCISFKFKIGHGSSSVANI